MPKHRNYDSSQKTKHRKKKF